jgi:deoxycytidylate deaminase
MNDTEVANGLKQLFNHRKQLLILGLTGRTGSGCTTLSKVLQANNFLDLEVRRPKIPALDHDDRKYRMVFEWITANWHPFKRISVSELITGYILAQGFDSFSEFIKMLSNENSAIQAFEDDSFSHLSTLFTATSNLAISTKLWDPSWESRENEIFGDLQFIFNELPEFSIVFRKALTEISPNLDSIFFQTAGDNIRRSGNPYLKTVIPEMLFTIPRLLERIIDLSIQSDSNFKLPTYLVIDAIRHPFEARYLQERYAFFYLVAVTATDEDRKKRLIAQQFRADEISRLDLKEYPREKKTEKLSGYSLLVSQDIQSSIENADIYLFNKTDSSSPDSPHELKEQMLRYISLMMHPGLVTPTSVERCMQSAFTAKLNSGCISRQVGAVVADKGFSIKAIGWNDVPKGQVPCALRNVRHLFAKQDPDAFSDYENGEEFKNYISNQPIALLRSEQYEGRNLSFCFKSNYNTMMNEKNQVHTRSLHAEENAFLQLARGTGQVTEGGYLFTTASPCELCAKKAFQLGVSTIYFIDPYPGISNTHVLAQGRSSARPNLMQFTGAVGRTYHQLFSPIMPMKDELAFLIP